MVSPLSYQVNHYDMNPSFTRRHQRLVIFAQLATLIALRAPPLRPPTLLSIRPLPTLKLDAATLSKVPHPFDQFPSIRAIGPDQAHSLSCWQRAHPTSAAPVLCVGGGHDSNQLQAKRLAQNVPFAHQNLLASIIAALTATICGLDRLRVENRGRRRKLSTRSFANQLAQAVRDALSHAFPSWQIKYHCFPRGE